MKHFGSRCAAFPFGPRRSLAKRRGGDVPVSGRRGWAGEQPETCSRERLVQGHWAEAGNRLQICRKGLMVDLDL